MGCGISRFDPKEVVEATTKNSNHNNPSHYSTHKSSYSASNCFTGESKHSVHQECPPAPEPRHSSPDRATPTDQKMMKMNIDVKREEAKGINNNEPRMRMGTRIKTPMRFDDDDSSNDDMDENDQNCREICRGGSPSFREYCVDSESRSRSMTNEDDCEGDHCKWPSKDETLNCEKEKGRVDNEIGKKERRGKGIRNALQRGISGGGGVKNLRLQQQHNTNFSSHQLLAKAS